MIWLMRQFNVQQWEDKMEETELEFETPALGDGFTFQVVIRCVREAGGRRHDRAFWSDVEEEQVRAHDLVRRVARDVCRRHSAFSPGQAERETSESINAAFAAHPTLRGRWSVQVHVNLSDEVRSLQREAQMRMQKIISEGEAVALRLQKIQELTGISEGLLSSATGQWIARYAVRLAQQPEAAADVVAQMLDERQERAERLVKLVDEMVAVHQQAGIFDLVIASEGALRHALKQLGVDVPPLESDSIFADADLFP
ncbi:hypothetical protein ACFYOK_18125 [Microbispora bryophytorum]|uniref:hypothetical protein n=1 Tax=Microbispora bryophytorum TaxID=1460882 RepID=UPI0033F05C15